jgi:putative copper export protein
MVVPQRREVRGLYHVSVWLHLAAAASWVGSLVFIAAVLVPVLRRGDEATRSRVLRESGPALRALGWISFAVLLVTGVFNIAARGYRLRDLDDRLWQGPFGHALTWKLLLFAGVLGLSAVHDFRLGPRAAGLEPGSPAALRSRRLASWIGRLNLLLALAILFFATMLVRGWP